MTAEEGVPVSPGIKHVAALEQASRVLTLVCAQDEQGLMTGLALVPSTHLWGIGWEVTQQFTVLAGAANHTKKRGGSCWELLEEADPPDLLPHHLSGPARALRLPQVKSQDMEAQN